MTKVVGNLRNAWLDSISLDSSQTPKVSNLNGINASLSLSFFFFPFFFRLKTCQVCKKGDNDECLLLCDGCDRGCHMYCLRPKITQIPEGDWFCPTCVAKVRTPRVFLDVITLGAVFNLKIVSLKLLCFKKYFLLL